MRSLRLVKLSFVALCNRAEIITRSNNHQLIEATLTNLNEEFRQLTEIFEELISVDESEAMINELIEFQNKHQATVEILVNGMATAARGSETSFSQSSEIAALLSQQTSILSQMSTNQANMATGMTQVKLKNLSLPKFSGSYSEWSSFHDIFEATIHNNKQLSSIEKFYHLKSLLIDEAAAVIRSIQLTSDNYEAAWTMLNRRFNKPFLIIRSLINDCANLESVSRSSNRFRQFSSKFIEIINSLNSLGDYATSRDPWVIQIIMSKFDTETKQAWADESHNLSCPQVNDLIKFLEKQSDTLELLQNPTRKERPTVRLNNVLSAKQCFICFENHPIHKCQKFLSLSIQDREKAIAKQSRCYNCFGKGHGVKNCLSTHTCLTCKRKHHSTLHRSIAESQPSAEQESSSTPATGGIVRLNYSGQSSESLLPTALVSIKDSSGNSVQVRALLDTGAQSSFISEHILKKLQLKRHQEHVPILCLSDSKEFYSKGRVSLSISSIYDKDYVLHCNAEVIPKAIKQYPSVSSVVAPELKHHFNLADPNFSISSDVHVILGASLFFEILLPDKYLHKAANLYIQNTHLGHVVCSKKIENVSPILLNSAIVSDTQFEFERNVERFWSLDEPQVSPNKLSVSEEECEKFVESTLCRLPSGRFQVRLPFSVSSPALGRSYDSALKRFLSLERRLSLHSDLRESYVDFMNEYEILGHMSVCSLDPASLTPNKHYIIPHHAVWQPGKKLRVVFDASSPTSSGKSLNDNLHVGPPLQTDIAQVLLSFRTPKYVCVADLVKMYRQIEVHPDDQLFQLILWRSSVNDPIKLYQLKTVTYGVSSAPYLALKVLQKLVESVVNDLPVVADVLSKNRFVDDFFFGANTTEDLINLKSLVKNVLASASFKLHKWSANDPSILVDVAEEDLALPHCFTKSSSIKQISTLGLLWSPTDDSFTYNFKLNELRLLTKRILLQETARLYDPLGFLTPIVAVFKMLFQETWATKLDWDAVLPDSLSTSFLKNYSELSLLNNLKIPRWIGGGSVEIHGFADASVHCYAAVVYARVLEPDGSIKIRLLTAKSKLAPLKPISIPRLELCAAHLLAKVITSISPIFESMKPKFYLWSDSSTVLSWLRSLPRKWTTFVANRVSHIQELCPDVTWMHVRSEDNPADVASRGISPSKLLFFDLWWNGPKFLKCPQTSFRVEQFLETTEELKTQVKVFTATSVPPFSSFISKFSSFGRLIRTIAYVYRFHKSFRNAFECRTTEITVLEYKHALISVVRLVQRSLFPDEYEALSNSRQLPKDCPLTTLSPFLDADRIIRVGGRLQNSNFESDFKHPILLKDCNFVSLLLSQVHLKNFHAGISLMTAHIRKEYWILNFRCVLRKYLNACVVCNRYKKKTYEPEMGALPSNRLDPSKPFEISGVDFAGPVSIRPYRGRGKITLKGYIALFVCFSTKAVHLELVMGLDTNSFKMALQRFLSRRGRCKLVWSDNGKNFVGLNRDLSELKARVRKQIDSAEIKNFLLENLIEWKFIPPYSPHFGGLWEAGIKQVKVCLTKAVSDHVLTLEEFQTCLCQIEHILNSRPLTPISFASPLIPITPNHFLHTSSNFYVPSFTEFSQPKGSLSNRYQLLQSVQNSFWKRWKFEYLDTLMRKPKWIKPNSQPNIGDVVAIKRNFSTPSHWSLGIIERLYPGKGGITRVVDVRTPSGTHREAVRNLVPLLVDANASTGGVC